MENSPHVLLSLSIVHLRILTMTFRPSGRVAFFAMLLATLHAQPPPARSYYDGYDPFFPVAESVNTFGAKLLVEYRKEQNPNTNVVFSPLNLVVTFHLLYEGAGGTTKAQINKLLNFSDPEVSDSLTGKSRNLAERDATRMAYRLYVDHSVHLLPEYVDHVGARRVLSVDFANNSESVRTEINNWVDTKTRGLIPTLVSEEDITSMTIMALVNALYFKGTWKHPFDPNMTETGVFHGVNGDQNVSYLTLYDEYLLYKEVWEMGGVMVELPYKEDKFGLYVFLPDEADGWKEAEKVYPRYAGKLFDTDFTSQNVEVLKLPKWELDFNFEGLEDGLMSLGITDLFSPFANLSAMTNSTQLVLSNLIHKAKIIVNEEGTEAAAATISVVNRSAANSNPITIIVDRPFLYFVLDRSDRTVLFQGTQTSFH